MFSPLLLKSFLLLLLCVFAGCNGISEEKVNENLEGMSKFSSLEIAPSATTIYVNQTQQFIASGGFPPYTFSLVNGSGSVSLMGLYTAPSTKTSATIRVTDTKGTSRDALLVVDIELAITPSSRKININSSFQFATTGGTPPYVYSVTSGASTVATDGTFTSAASPESAVVRVTDASGYSSEASIEVGNGPIINPTVFDLPINSTHQFTITSGTAPFTWSIVTGAGSVDSNGLYSSSPTAGTATVRVMDANGFYSESFVSIFKRNQISTGANHTCVLNGSTNTTKCWGHRAFGALGDGTFTIGDEAADMGDNLDSIKLPTSLTAEPLIMATTYYNGCAIFDDGLTRCWGYSGHGQNGNNTTSNGIFNGSSEGIYPVPADLSNPIVDLARKSNAVYHQCGIYQDGTLKCWGYNAHGQLGQDNTLNYGANYSTLSLYSAAPINLGQTVLQVDTGVYHTCAVLADKNVKCWGYNAYGQLGLQHANNTGDAAGEMATVSALDFPSDVIDLTTGGYHNCVILTGGTVHCWGYSSYGERGLGTTGYYGDATGEDPILSPAVPLGTGRTAIKVDAGFHHTCALLDNSQVKCWGYNGHGQLGQEDTFHRGDNPGELGDTLPAVYLGIGRTAVDIFVGGYQSCAKLDNGEVKCWGNNDYGQLGIGLDRRLDQGDAANEMGDNLNAVNLGSTVTNVLQMSTFWPATCALVDQSGITAIKCFGQNDNGILGNEDGATGDEPSELGSNTPNVNLGTTKEIAALTGGHYHNCAQFTDGSVKCWGHNGYNILGTNGAGGGLVGQGANDMGTNLTYFIGGSGTVVNKLAASKAGVHSACAILNGTTLKCWGYNGYGQLGQDDVTTRYYIPTIAAVNVGAGRIPIDFDLGYLRTCTVSDDGSVRCWGYNNFGQLGLEHTTTRGNVAGDMASNVLVNLGTGVQAQKLCTGNYHTCALTPAGKIKCWGYNANGELGIGSNLHTGDEPGEMGDALPFVNLGTGRTVTKLSCGTHHTCALLDNKKVKCWGYNAFGQLGLGHTGAIGISPSQMGDALSYVNLGTGRTAIDIVMGENHSCVLLDNNQVKCWGNNDWGQLAKGNIFRLGDNLGEMGDNLLPIDLD